MTRKKTALVVCPGRGTYNKNELGYLARHHGHRQDMLAMFEAERARLEQTPLAELDGAERFSVATHTRGDNASLLIHACAYGDYLAIDPDKFEIVALTGNSMGWYIASACAGAVSPDAGGRIVNTMGTFMQDAMIGGQLVHPLVDENWQRVVGRREDVLAIMAQINALPDAELYVSIELGGMLVLAGNEKGVKAAMERLPVVDQFPMQLANHAAFHTHLQAPVSERGLSALTADLFGQPDTPLIDGRGHIWRRGSTAPSALHAYTLGHQVVERYDFTKAIEVGMREFAPDCLIVTGPGTTLGGAVAQSLIGMNWQGLASKQDFIDHQESEPIVLAMGREDQRELVV